MPAGSPPFRIYNKKRILFWRMKLFFTLFNNTMSSNAFSGFSKYIVRKYSVTIRSIFKLINKHFYNRLRIIILFYFLKKLLIYSWDTHTHRERERERGRDTGRGRSRLHAGSLTWNSIPGLQGHTPAEGGAKPLNCWATWAARHLALREEVHLF